MKENAGVVSRVRQVGMESLMLCSPVKAELWFGACKSQRVTENQHHLRQFFDDLPSLPPDDSALQWAPIGSGRSADPRNAASQVVCIFPAPRAPDGHAIDLFAWRGNAVSMADTWITDLTHFLEDGRLPEGLPGPARRLAEHLGRIVAAVMGVEPDDPLGVPCRRRPGRRPCPGEIEGYIVPESNAIRWGCLVCGDNGLISNWENTMWDLREADEHTRH